MYAIGRVGSEVLGGRGRATENAEVAEEWRLRRGGLGRLRLGMTERKAKANARANADALRDDKREKHRRR
jgi:hypothetical protein